MYELAHPWALVLLAAPLLVWWLLPPYRERKQAVRIPFFAELVERLGRDPSRGAVVLRKNRLQLILAPLMWALIVLALAAPQWIEPPIERTETARDLLLAVDLSGSMETRDFVDPEGNRLDRLSAVKLVLDDFIARREDDRIGLIVFADSAHLQVPFTLDHETARMLLEQTRVGMVGQQTMLGDAIGLAIQLFEESDAEERVLILLTDGNDSGSRVPPAKAAKIASDREITIHTVGVGDPATSGDDLVDLKTLEEIASVTGGAAFLASNREELEEIYVELDALEPQEINTLSYRPRTPLFYLPAGAAVALVFLYHLIMALAAAMRRRGMQHV